MRGDQSLKWSTRMLQPWLGLPENPPRQNEVISVRNTVNFNQLNRLFHGMRKPQMHFFSCRCGTSTMEKRTGWEPDQRDHVHCCTEQPSGPKVSHSHRDTGLSMPDSSHTYSAGRYVELILLRYCIRVYCMLWRFSHLKSKPGSGPNVFWFFFAHQKTCPMLLFMSSWVTWVMSSSMWDLIGLRLDQVWFSPRSVVTSAAHLNCFITEKNINTDTKPQQAYYYFMA